jgi:hypothetical protein
VLGLDRGLQQVSWRALSLYCTEEHVPFALVGKKMTWSYFRSPRRKRDSDSLFGVSYVILKPLPIREQLC